LARVPADAVFRPVCFGDVDLVCDQRLRMFQEARKDPGALARMQAPFQAWLQSHLRSGQYLGWIAEDGGRAIGGVGLMFLDFAPGPSHPDCDRRGFVLNLFVEPDRRGEGVAKALMRKVEDEARARATPFLVLHASDLGRPLYESMNWRATNEMSLTLNLQD
jgi:GNAT superfamily N-acetyltransferase